MPIYHPPLPDEGHPHEQIASTNSLPDEDDDRIVQQLYEELAGLTARQFDELSHAITTFNDEINYHQLVEDAVLNTIAHGFRAFIERSEYLYDDKADAAIFGISILAYDAKGFDMAVECLFQLTEKHYSRDTILRPNPTRHPINRAMREREEMEAVEFLLLRILSTHWSMTCLRYDSGPITRDPTLLLHTFFRKHGWFMDWIGGFEFIGRLAVISHKRQVAIMSSNKALAARLPVELVETVQDSICDVEGVKKLLSLVGETNPDSVDRIWGQWMNDKFSELSL